MIEANATDLSIFLQYIQEKHAEELAKKSVLYNFDFKSGIPIGDSACMRFVWKPTKSGKRMKGMLKKKIRSECGIEINRRLPLISNTSPKSGTKIMCRFGAPNPLFLN